MHQFTDFLIPAPPGADAVVTVSSTSQLRAKKMSSTRNSEKWLMLKWGSGGTSVVNLKSVTSPTTETRVGIVVVADKGNGIHEAATIIGSSRDRQILERHIPKEQTGEDDTAGPSKNEEPEDFSASASSWEPSDDHPSSDDEEVDRKKIKLERIVHARTYCNRRTSKILKPSHRANAINAIIAKNRKRTFGNSTHKEQFKNTFDRKSLPDSTRKNNTPTPNTKSDVVSINVRDIMHMKQCFHEVFKILNEIKPCVSNENSNVSNLSQEKPVKEENNINKMDNTTNVDEGEDDMEASDRSEEFNRSDDNVLITNKYENAMNNNKNSNEKVLAENTTNKKEKLDEWMPIGTGQTLIHRDQYRKVNWKSYTIATRTLLLAVFPRRILATHSLTGKKSPAFLDKPAKMCLDPKIVTDVIIEICDRFKVKENLVRSIITTKCADECKMLKTRQKRKTLPAKQQPTVKSLGADDEANMTC
ncbi:uncharacterized protein LOC126373609 isoform X2 [Pectinophora gossypiella]|uniref:uncharacterized protein LOC126373609 isoform X2 n=1 Tax=Pectinophora gossypiella TaxID=13191 RepID=UPI00214EA935|nr:uncharacterized protein LOC126373609 isoform X2 [Pectinophora gossypiella]